MPRGRPAPGNRDSATWHHRRQSQSSHLSTVALDTGPTAGENRSASGAPGPYPPPARPPAKWRSICLTMGEKGAYCLQLHFTTMKLFSREPQVQWLSSLTAPTAANLQIEIMGVSVCLEQNQKSSSDDVKIEIAKPSTVGTGVIVWVGMHAQFCRLDRTASKSNMSGRGPVRSKVVRKRL